MDKRGFVELVCSAFRSETVKKITFSKPGSSEVTRISGREVAHRGQRFLRMEYSLPGNTVSQRNVGEGELSSEIEALCDEYAQINLITTLGDAEYKRSKKGKITVIGGDTLAKKTAGGVPDFERAIGELDRKKNYILRGDEEFLKKLGISSQDGRIHDKRQGKFRQINKFLEHLESVYPKLPSDGELIIYDLCCGKSYLSFAVYYYLTEIKGRRVRMLGADLKRDVILWCEALARELGYVGMRFEVADILTLPLSETPDMVISLHACDIATDIVLDTAIRLGAGVILSTPCCHRYLNGKVAAKELSFVTEYPHIANKLCEALTDSIRLGRLKAHGYTVTALELTDPENTPKNTLIRAIKRERIGEEERVAAEARYAEILRFVLGDGAENYLKEIKNPE